MTHFVYHAFLRVALPIVMHLHPAPVRLAGWHFLERVTPASEKYMTR